MKSLHYVLIGGMLAGMLASAAETGRKHDPQAWFSKMDKNGDGKISLEEFSARKSKKAATTTDGTDKRAARFKKMDTNGDGFITADEFQAAMARRSEQHQHHSEQPQTQPQQ